MKQDFLQYLKDERARYAAFVLSLHLPSSQKVKAEDFAIAFDQLLEAYEDKLKGKVEQSKLFEDDDIRI